MKKLLPLLCFICLLGQTKAQQVNFDTLNYSLETPSPEFREYLVQLAWINNPSNEVLEHKVDIAETDVKIAKLDWANDIGLTFNLNENNLRKQDTSIPELSPKFIEDTETATNIPSAELNALIDGADADRGIVDLGDFSSLSNFPRYNIGITVNLGRIINLNKEIQKSKFLLKIEEATLDQQKLEIRSEVYRRYEAYQQTFEVYKIRQQAETDYQQGYKIVEERFKKGVSDFEEFSRASSAYQNAREGTVLAKADIANTKIDLEELIGIALEYAMAFHKEALKEPVLDFIEE